MTEESTPAKVRLSDGLGPLPPCARAVEYNTAKGYSFDAYTAEQMLSYAAAAVAGMRADLAEYFALADASWRETCDTAKKAGITSIPIGPAHAAALDKFNDLRTLYGPNAQAHRPDTAR